MSDSPGTPSATSQGKATPLELALISCWAVAVMGLGGFACGLVITKFGTLGAASLWLLGEAAGFVGRRLVSNKSKLAGLILVVACIGALLVAEVCWIHWATRQGEESWLAAVRLLPTFVQEFSLSALIGAFFCCIGANSAYRQVARRYRIVQIVED